MEENILVKITGEADLTEAQVQLRSMNDKGKELEVQMQQLIKAEKLQADVLSKMGNATSEARKQAEESLQTTRKQIREKQAEINANKKSIESLKNTMSAYNAMNGAGGKLAQQIKALREQMAQMEMAGDTSSAAFIELGVQAAKLQDQIGDTQAQIAVLASDTLKLDTVMSAGNGLVGGFNAVTSAMALFGGESEELQQAFLKVQAAMAMLNGVQQVANTLNKDSVVGVVLRTATEKLHQKTLNNSAKFERLYNIQKIAGTAANGAQAASTGILTKAQWKLNAAMAANPIGAIVTIVIAAVAAIAALAVGVYKLVGAFSAEASAARAAKKAQEEYDKQNKLTTYNLNLYSKAHSKTMDDIAKREQADLNEKRRNHASSAEIHEAELAYLKERAAATLDYQKKAVDANNKEQIAANAVYNAKLRQLNAVEKGSKKYYKALEELTEAERKMNEVWQRGRDITKQLEDSRQAVIDKEQQIADEQLELQKRLNQSRINLMKEGSAKEIAQIKANYAEQLKEISGNTAKETALRASLVAEQNKAIAEVRRKYRLKEQSEQLDALKNMFAADESNYELKKAIIEEEADYKIASLDKQAMSEQDYANKVQAIRIQLQHDLNAVDDESAKRYAALEQTKTQTAIAAAKARAKAEYSPEVYNLQRELLQSQEQAEIDAVNRSTATQEEKESQIAAIRQRYSDEYIALKNDESAQIASIAHQEAQNELTERENAATRTLNSTKSSIAEQAAAYNELKRIRDERLDDEEAAVKESYQRGEMNYAEYQARLLEIERERIDNEIADEQEKMETIKSLTGEILQFVGDMASEIFGAISDNIQQQLDDLDEYYTTDAEEAKEDANKKYISEKELEDKKLALKRKAAAVEKASAAFSIAISTAMAIMNGLNTQPMLPLGVAMAAMAGAMGAAQLAMVLAKPLPKYAKGRKRGKGEYAMVGERGAELMYIPDNASIVPHHHLTRPDKWGDYNVPMPYVPAQPNIEREIMRYAVMQQVGFNPDYDRFGRAVAEHIIIPEQKAVYVNVDRSGIGVTEGGDTHHYLNRKYAGAWN